MQYNTNSINNRLIATLALFLVTLSGDSHSTIAPYPWPPEQRTNVTQETCTTLINISTFCYAAYTIYHRYMLMAVPSNDQSLIAKALYAISPAILVRLGTHSHFLLDTLGIIGKTLFYKTIAKLLLFCATNDLVDTVYNTARYAKKIITH